MRKEFYKKPLTPQGEKDLKNLKEKFKNSSNKEKYEVEASEQPSKKCGGKVKKHAEGNELLPIKVTKGKPSKNINRGGTKSKISVQSCGSKIKVSCGGAKVK